MEKRIIDEKLLLNYEQWLHENERSRGTTKRYCAFAHQFLHFLEGRSVCKEEVVRWKEQLRERVSPSTVNVALAALNSLFRYMGRNDCIIKFLKVKRQMFCPEEKELTREEYQKLVLTAESNGNERLALLIQTVCATGIRVSELENITVEAARKKQPWWTARESCAGFFFPQSCAGFFWSTPGKRIFREE